MDYVGWQRVAEDSIVARGPVEFWGVVCRSGAGGVGNAIVFDGVNANGRRYISYNAPQNQTATYIEEEPAIFQQGIFVDIDANVTEILVRYRPLREEDFAPGHVAPAEG